MNIYSKLLLGAAVFSLAACSSKDEPVIGDEEGKTDVIKPSGDVAYLNVRIQSADDSRSRAGEPDYYYGDENQVENAYFYFYDEKGEFVLESNIWLGPDGTYAGDADYIEMKGQKTVVLTGLKDKSYPSYVVTVLNRPDTDANGAPFAPGATLEEMGNILLGNFNYVKQDKTYFVMTSSSYYGEDHATDNNGEVKATYFATKLKDTDFKDEVDDTKPSTVVDIFVERLAARVGVSLALENERYTGATYKANGQEYPLYELNVSVSGETNPSLGEGATTAATKVYVAILGWELNSTAVKSKLMKDLDGFAASDGFGTSWAWNKPAHHRSFWGKAVNYGLESADVDSKGLIKTNDFTWSQLTKQVSEGRFIGDRAYCHETTNKPEYITDDNQILPKYTPTVVLSAIVCDKNGNPLSLVNYQGIEYTKDSFVKRILAIANGTKFYTQDGTTYNQIGVNDVKLISAGHGLGSVNVALKSDAINYFKLKAGATTDSNGNYPTDAFIPATVQEINAHFAQYTDENHKAIAKTEGAMYYTIPLKHLNVPTTTNTIVEGQYGVVRNHIYDLSINKVKTLGEGVFDPESEKVDPVEPKNPSFSIESAINILSWKIVSQTESI